MDLMNALLSMELPKPATKEFKIKRLSELCGKDVVFTIKQLSFNQVDDLKKGIGLKQDILVVLAGVVSPDLKAKELLDKFDAPTPAELLKKMLLPGEIEDLSREVERLCGYRENTIEEIKKN